MEKRPEDQGLIEEIFRYAHTFKGAANVVKLPRISQLVHKIEDRLARFIDQEKKATSEHITLLLDAVTVIRKMVNAIKDGRSEDSVDTSVILEKLNKKTRCCGHRLEDREGPKLETDELRKKPDVHQKKFSESVDRKQEAGNLRHATSTSNPAMEIQNTKPQIQNVETLRIKSRNMDRLTNLSNEILINHLRLKDIVENFRLMTKQSGKTDFSNGHLMNLMDELEPWLDWTGVLSEEMNDIIMNTRLVSVDSYAYLFEKMVRDLAVETNKKIDFSIEGGDLFLDRSLLEQIKEPVYHLLRNSVVHGVESSSEREENGKGPAGVIVLKFGKAGDYARIICQDDGRGMDPEELKNIALKKKLVDPKTAEEMSEQDALYLILKSGFSSSEILTELSGRGVGLDVVKSKTSALGGSLDIKSERGQFTRITLILPLSINMVDVFMVEISDHNLLIPLKNVLETRLIEKEEIDSEAGEKVVPFNGFPVPLINLANILGLKEKDTNKKRAKAILVKGSKEILALNVDDFKGKESILLKTLEGLQKKIGCIRSSTILKNGDPAFVLDIGEIFERVKVMSSKEAVKIQEEKIPSILVVDDSLTTRALINGILRGEGFSVQLAQSGEEAMDILEKDSFDLALVDIQMPHMNGFELSQKIRQSLKHRDTPIVILSSLASEEDKRRGIEVGANAYIVKSNFDQESFLETVASFI